MWVRARKVAGTSEERALGRVVVLNTEAKHLILTVPLLVQRLNSLHPDISLHILHTSSKHFLTY